MKAIFCLITLALGSNLALAQADTASTAADTDAETAVPQRPVHFYLGGGLAYGGDDLVRLEYTDGETGKIKAGSGITLDAGVLWTPPNSDLQLQFTYGIQSDSDSAENADISFDRERMELLAFYQIRENHRLGFGFSKHMDIQFDYDFAGERYKLNYEDATGIVLEWDFFSHIHTNSIVSIGLRFVNIHYEPESQYLWNGYTLYEQEKLDGSHFAVVFGIAL